MPPRWVSKLTSGFGTVDAILATRGSEAGGRGFPPKRVNRLTRGVYTVEAILARVGTGAGGRQGIPPSRVNKGTIG